MSVVSAAAPRAQSQTALVAVLALLALGALWFIRKNVLHYADYSLAAYTDYYWPRRWGLIPHIVGGLTAISAGLVQIWLGLTNRVGVLHRTLGKVYAIGVLVGSSGAFYMALTIPSKYLVYGVGLFVLATAWVVTTAMALLAIRNRHYEQHREWMLRSYTVTFAFATFRIFDQWLVDLHIGSQDEVDAIMAWACWAVPLLLIEPLIQLRRLGRAAIHGAPASAPISAR